jgi:hypothetical protein
MPSLCMMWTIAVAISSFAFTPITGSSASHNGLYSAFRNCQTWCMWILQYHTLSLNIMIKGNTGC